MKITDLKCAIIGNHPVIRIVTDQGIDGWGEVESSKPYLKPHVLFYKQYLLGQDPTDVERCMMRIRRMGAFKPWGSAVAPTFWHGLSLEVLSMPVKDLAWLRQVNFSAKLTLGTTWQDHLYYC